MNKRNTLLAAMTLICSLGASEIRACWAPMPLEEAVKGTGLVVVGEIQRVDPAPKTDGRAYDTAFIKIERILKNTATNGVAKVGSEIPLASPAQNGQPMISTDIPYKKGQRGVWLLEYRDGKHWATEPWDLQPAEKEAEITDLIQQQAVLPGGKDTPKAPQAGKDGPSRPSQTP